MKALKISYLLIFAAFIVLPLVSCKNNSVDSTGLYIPSNADVTANATLQELKDGRALYINNCGACHSLYQPENFTPAKWKNIMSTMASRTNLSTSEIQLVTKYVSKGK